MASKKKRVIVREVWARNLDYEFALIQTALPFYPMASLDTEFPGVIFNPYKDKPVFPKLSHVQNYNYTLMKANVDALKIIQIGLTLSDGEGNLPDFGTKFSYVWEFNFQDFDIEADLYNMNSILLLQQQGINFFKNKAEGIPSWAFRVFILNSGLLFNRCSVTWVSFHSCYDFGFMIKILTANKLPLDVTTFKAAVNCFFGPTVFDVKSMLKSCDGLYGGLERVAKALSIDRVVGKSHQAGSDSLLILHTFLKLTNTYFSGGCGGEIRSLTKYQGVLYGLETRA